MQRSVLLRCSKVYSFDNVLTAAHPTIAMRHTTFVDVNLSKLSRNFARIQQLAGPGVRVLPMVKGNAYGSGILQVSAFLSREVGVRRLGVASLGEALAILEALPAFANDPSSEIFVFSDTELHDRNLIRCYDRDSSTRKMARLFPVLGTREDLELALESDALRTLPLVVKINTGMNRMGLLPAEVLDAVPRIKARRGGRIHHLMQHFATSWFPLATGDRTQVQYRMFLDTKAQLEAMGISVEETSAANSGAIEQRFAVNETYVRPGLMLYGPASVTEPSVTWTGEQVSTLHTKVLRCMPLRAGEYVGYGLHPVTSDCVVALLPIGYADGFLRYYSGLGIDICGLSGTVHGLVNMDLTAVRLEPRTLNLSVAEIQERIRVGAPVVVWDRNLAGIADDVKTNPYQLMTGLSVRLPRRYSVDY